MLHLLIQLILFTNLFINSGCVRLKTLEQRNEHSLSRHRRSANTLTQGGANVCEYTDTKTVYQVVYKTYDKTHVTYVCCKQFVGCWKKCKRTRVTTHQRSETQSGLRSFKALHCCNGWSVDKTGLACTRPVCFPACQNGGTCVAPNVCSCKAGFTGKICQLDIDECAVGKIGDTRCNKRSGSVCNNLPGSFYCSCKKGFVPTNQDSSQCTDADECSAGACKCAPSSPGCTATCTNTPGSFKCICSAGYRWTYDNMCVDVNECLSNQHQCKQGCVNTDGGYNCTCFDAFKWDRGLTKCIPKRFCSYNGGCEHECHELSFTYMCFCKSGYKLAADNHRCLDINECTLSNPCDSVTSECENFDGGYHCKCKRGFRKAYNNLLCIDQDECAEHTAQCEQKCTNTVGSYTCGCNTGYTLNPDMRTCRDIDECQLTTTTSCQQKCVNTIGSYICECNPGYILGTDGRSCRPRRCEAVVDPFYGTVSCDGFTVGRTCWYSCDNGFVLEYPNRARHCLPNGKWSGPENRCLPQRCDIPTPPAHGKLKLPCDLSYQSTCPVSCLDGYILRGKEFIKCGFVYRRLQWDKRNVRCEEILVCSPNPCKNSGHCSIVTDKEYHCNCSGTGHTGKNCDLLLVNTSPIPKLQINTDSGNLKLAASPVDWVKIQIMPEASSKVMYTPGNVTLTYFQQYANYQFKSSVPGLMWTRYKLDASDEKTHPLPDSLTFFYKPSEMQSITGNSLLSMSDQACHHLTVQPNTCPGKLLKLSSTSKWSTKYLGDASFSTSGIVFIKINGKNFPLILSSKIDVSEYINDFSSHATMYIDSINNRACSETMLTNGQLQTAVKDDYFVKDFLIQFNELTPSWFSLDLQTELKYIHRDNIQTYIWSGQRVEKETSCTGAAVDKASLFLVYLHHESIDMKVDDKTVVMTTKRKKFCFLINLCTGDTHFSVPKENKGDIKSLFSFHQVETMGWNISVISIGFRQGRTKDEKRKCGKPNVQQLVFGSAAMTYKKGKVQGEIYGNLVYDIMQDPTGKQTIAYDTQCFDGQSKFDTDTWYTADTIQKRYVKQQTPHNVINTKSIKASDKRHLLRIMQDRHSIFRVKTGFKPIIVKSKSGRTELNFLFKASPTKSTTSSSIDTSSILMLEFILKDLTGYLTGISISNEPLKTALANLLTEVREWSTRVESDVIEIYDNGRDSDVTFLQQVIFYSYSKAKYVIGALQVVINSIRSDSNIRQDSLSNLEYSIGEIKTLSADLKKNLPSQQSAIPRHDLDYLSLHFNGSVCLFAPCLDNTNITMHPVAHDVGFGTLCNDNTKSSFDIWQTEARIMDSSMKGNFFYFNENDKLRLCLTREGVKNAQLQMGIQLFGSLHRGEFFFRDGKMNIPEQQISIRGKYDFKINSTVDFELKRWDMVSIETKGQSTTDSLVVRDIQTTLDIYTVSEKNRLEGRIAKKSLTISQIRSQITEFGTVKANLQAEYNRRTAILRNKSAEYELTVRQANIWKARYTRNLQRIRAIESKLSRNCTIKTCRTICHNVTKCNVCQDPYKINIKVPSCKTVVEDRSYGFLKSEQDTCSHLVEETRSKYTGDCQKPRPEKAYAEDVIARIQKKLSANETLTIKDAEDLKTINETMGRKLQEDIKKQTFFQKLEFRLKNCLLTEEDFEKLTKYENQSYSNKIRKKMKEIQDVRTIRQMNQKLRDGQKLTEADYDKLRHTDPPQDKKFRQIEAINEFQTKVKLTGNFTEEDIGNLRKYAPEQARNITKMLENQQQAQNLVQNILEKMGKGKLTSKDIELLEQVNPNAAKKLKEILKEQLSKKFQEMDKQLNSVKGLVSRGLNNTDAQTLQNQLNTLTGSFKVYDEDALKKLQDQIRSNNATTNGSLYDELRERLDLDYVIKNMTGVSKDLHRIFKHFFGVLPRFDIPQMFQENRDSIVQGLLDVQEWFEMSVHIMKQACEQCVIAGNCTRDDDASFHQFTINLQTFHQKTCTSKWAVGSRQASGVDDICTILETIVNSLQSQPKTCTDMLRLINQPLKNVIEKWKTIRSTVESAQKEQWKNNADVINLFGNYSSFQTDIKQAFSRVVGASSIPFISQADVMIAVQQHMTGRNGSTSNSKLESLIIILKNIMLNMKNLPSIITQNNKQTISLSSTKVVSISQRFDLIVDFAIPFLQTSCVSKPSNLQVLLNRIARTKTKIRSVLQSTAIDDIYTNSQQFYQTAQFLMNEIETQKTLVEDCQLATTPSQKKKFKHQALVPLYTFLREVKPLRSRSVQDVANDIHNLINEISSTGSKSPIGKLLDIANDFINESPSFDLPIMLSLPPKVSSITFTSFKKYLESLSDMFSGMDDVLKKCKGDCNPQDVFGKTNLAEITAKLDSILKPISKTGNRYRELVKNIPKGFTMLTSGLEEVRTALQTFSRSETGFSKEGFKNVITAFKDAVEGVQLVRKNLVSAYKSLNGLQNKNVKQLHHNLKEMKKNILSLYQELQGDVERQLLNPELERLRNLIEKIEKVPTDIDKIKYGGIQRQLEMSREAGEVVGNIGSLIKNLYSSKGLDNQDKDYINAIFIPSVVPELQKVATVGETIFEKAQTAIAGIGVDLLSSNTSKSTTMAMAIKRLENASNDQKQIAASHLASVSTAFSQAFNSLTRSIEELLEEFTGSISKYKQQYKQLQQRLKKYGGIFDDVKETITELKDKPLSRIGEIKDTIENMIDSIDDYNLPMILSADPELIPKKVQELRQLFNSTSLAFNEIDSILRRCKSCKIENIFGYRFMKQTAGKLETTFVSMFERMEKYANKAGDTIDELKDITAVVKNIKGKFEGINHGKFGEKTFQDLSKALMESADEVDELQGHVESISKIVLDKDIDLEVIDGNINKVLSMLHVVVTRSGTVADAARNVYSQTMNMKTRFDQLRNHSSGLQNGPLKARLDIAKSLAEDTKDLLNEIPTLLQLSQETLQSVGIDEKWISNLGAGIEGITNTLTSFLVKTDDFLEAAGIAIKGSKNVEAMLPDAKMSLKEMVNAPWDQKLPAVQGAIRTINSVLNTALNTTIQSSNSLGISLTRDGLKTEFADIVGKKNLQKYQTYFREISIKMNRLQSGPIAEIGKLTDSVEDFADAMEGYDFGTMWLQGPQDLKNKVTEFRQLAILTGNIIQDIGNLTGVCNSCDIGSIFGNRFANSFTNKLQQTFVKIEDQMKKFVDRVKLGDQGWKKMVTTAREISNYFKGTSDGSFTRQKFLDISEALSKSAVQLEDFANGSADIFRALFNGDSDMDSLQQNFESFIGQVSHVLNKSSVILPKVGEVFQSVQDAKNQINKIKENVEDVTEGPVEARIEALKKITKGINGVSDSLPLIFNQSTQVLLELGMNSSWFRKVGSGFVALSEGIENVTKKTETLLDGAGIVVKDIKEIKGYVNGIKSDYQKILAAPWSQKFHKLTDALGKVNKILTTSDKTSKTISKTVTELFGENNSISKDLSQLTNNASGWIGNLTTSVEKFETIASDIATTIDQIKSGPVDKIGKLIDSTNEFVDKLKEQDIADTLVLAPKFAKEKLGEIKTIFSESGDILKNISALINKHCNSCKMADIFGRAFSSGLTKRIGNALENMTNKIENVLDKVDIGATSVAGIITSVRGIKGEIKKLNDFEFSEEGFDAVANVLANSSQFLDDIRNDSSALFNLLFDGDEEILQLTGKFEKFVGKVGSFLQRAGNFSEQVADAFGEAKKIRDTFVDTVNNFDKLTQGPLENRVKAVKNIADGVNKIMKDFPVLLQNSSLSPQWLKDVGKDFEGLTSSISNILNKTSLVATQVGETIGNVQDTIDTASNIGNNFRQIVDGGGSIGDKLLNANKLINNLSNLTDQINKVTENVNEVFKVFTDKTLFKSPLFGKSTADLLNKFSNGLNIIGDRYGKFTELSNSIKNAFDLIDENPVKFALEELPKIFDQSARFAELIYDDVKGISKSLGTDLDFDEFDSTLANSAKTFFNFANASLGTINSGMKLINNFKALFNSKTFKDRLENFNNVLNSGEKFLDNFDDLGSKVFKKWDVMKDEFKNVLNDLSNSFGLDLKQLGGALSKGLGIGKGFLSIASDIESLLKMKEFNPETLALAAGKIVNIAKNTVDLLGKFGVEANIPGLQDASVVTEKLGSAVAIFTAVKNFIDWLEDSCDITYEAYQVSRNITYPCWKEKLQIENVKIPVERCRQINETKVRGYGEPKLCCRADECLYIEETTCLQNNEQCSKFHQIFLQDSKWIQNDLREIIKNTKIYTARVQAKRIDVELAKVRLNNTMYDMQRAKAGLLIANRTLHHTREAHLQITNELQKIRRLVDNNGKSSIAILSVGFEVKQYTPQVKRLPLRVKYSYENNKENILELSVDFEKQNESFTRIAHIITADVSGYISPTHRHRRNINNGTQVVTDINIEKRNSTYWTSVCKDFKEKFELLRTIVENLEIELNNIPATDGLSNRRTSIPYKDNLSHSQAAQKLIDELDDLKTKSSLNINQTMLRWRRTSEVILTENIGSVCTSFTDCIKTQIDDMSLMFEPSMQDYQESIYQLNQIKTKLLSLRRQVTGKAQAVSIKNEVAIALRRLDISAHFCEERPYLQAEMPASVAAYIGRYFELKCTIDGPPSMKISWLRDDITLPNQNTWKLKLSEVSENDHGNYTCRGQTLTSTATSNQVLVRVMRPIQFKQQPKDIVLEYPGATEVSFVCNASSGTEETSYKWWFRPYSKTTPQLITQQAVLKIRPALSTNIGQYWCDVTDGYTSASSRKAKLDIVRMIDRKESARMHLALKTIENRNIICNLTNKDQINTAIRAALKAENNLAKLNGTLNVHYSKNGDHDENGRVAVDVGFKKVTTPSNSHHNLKFALEVSSARIELQSAVKNFVGNLKKSKDGLTIPWNNCTLSLSAMEFGINWQAEELTCPQGMASNKENTKCVQCTPGTFDNGKGTCASCPLGTYQPRAEQMQCLPCGNGMLTDERGATSSLQCKSQDFICEESFNFILLLDSAEHVTENAWNKTKIFARNILGHMKRDEDAVQLSMVSFGDASSIQFSLNTLQKMSGTKRLDVAFKTADKLIGDFDVTSSRNVILLVTEVNNNDLEYKIQKKARQLQSKGIEIYTILLNDSDHPEDDYLSLPSKPIEKHMFVSKKMDLTKWSTVVAKAVCRSYD